MSAPQASIDFRLFLLVWGPAWTNIIRWTHALCIPAFSYHYRSLSLLRLTNFVFLFFWQVLIFWGITYLFWHRLHICGWLSPFAHLIALAPHLYNSRALPFSVSQSCALPSQHTCCVPQLEIDVLSAKKVWIFPIRGLICQIVSFCFPFHYLSS